MLLHKKQNAIDVIENFIPVDFKKQTKRSALI